MYGDENFFVMVTKTSFGVFAFDATDYPEEFITQYHAQSHTNVLK